MWKLVLFALPLSVCGMSHGAETTAAPLGELKARMEMARERMLRGRVPAFTEDFILADVALRPDYPRRFNEYSGDLSGRVIGALACTYPGDFSGPLADLVPHLLEYQKPDGRFGDAGLVYAPDQIAMEHMALLWGNGRLLVGLLEYHEAAPSQPVLDACRKLGDFLLSVQDACANQAVADRVKDLGAAGMICFSHLDEGLVMLSEATGEAKYLEGAAKAAAWLPRDRAQQHSHGYLTTLRGMVLLSEATGDPAAMTEARDLFDNLLASNDLTVYGGIQEYFGGKGIRDEGCSEADFVRLGLQLWRATGDLAYLERAEGCLVNQFYANQFDTGDFGHQVYFDTGIAPFQGVGRAWWCCTMHGLRAMRDVADATITVDGNRANVNLYQEVSWSHGEAALDLERPSSATGATLMLSVIDAPEAGLSVAFRKPDWAAKVSLFLAGNELAVVEQEGYLVLEAPLKTGDRVEVRMDYAVRLVKRDGAVLAVDECPKEGVEAALFYGPWLMGVSEADNPMFFGEPWGDNRILLPWSVGGSEPRGPLVLNAAHLQGQYEHGGFPGQHPVTLRPVSERTSHGPLTFAVWLHFHS